MTRFHRMILRMLPGPFLGWLGTLIFLLLMQFLIRYLPDLVGKGLPFSVVVELVAYNLAYMVVLAVPMSVLIATLMTFGRLAETRAYAVMKSAGVSVIQLIWPVLICGFLLTAMMWVFNNEILPEANFRARSLWWDIRKKKPGFELQAGVFYNGINKYSILARGIPPDNPNHLDDVLIFDYSDGSRRRVDIKAASGEIIPIGDGHHIDVVLRDGEIHRRTMPPSMRDPERYERLSFQRHRLRLDLDDFAFERSDPNSTRRSDRTMRTLDMIRLVDSLDAGIAAQKERLFRNAIGLKHATVVPPPGWTSPPSSSRSDTTSISARGVLAGLTRGQIISAYELAIKQARLTRTEIDNTRRTVEWQAEIANRNRVEIHKKQSIALACLIFILVGAPLGLSIRRGGLATASALAIALFLFYWITLVQGEKLADRNLLSPWIGMWAANLVTIITGVWLMLYAALDLRATPPLRRRLADLFRRSRLA